MEKKVEKGALRIDKHSIMSSLIQHGKCIEKLHCIADKIKDNEEKISRDELLREEIIMEFQDTVNKLTQKNLDCINQCNSLIIQSIVSEKVKISQISEFFRWLIDNHIIDARGLSHCLANKLDEYCGQVIYSILLTAKEYEEFIPEDMKRHIQQEKENVKHRQRWECLERAILDEYLNSSSTRRKGR